MSCESFAEGQPCGLKCGGNGRFKSFEGVVIRNFGRGERGEGADVAKVIFGSDVDADRFKAKGEFVLEVSERERTVGGECEWRAADDLDSAAEGGGSVVGDAQRKDG